MMGKCGTPNNINIVLSGIILSVAMRNVVIVIAAMVKVRAPSKLSVIYFANF
jgi:hypothetical protein